MSLVSQQQPWHPAWSRQWVSQSTMQNDAGPPWKPQTIGNDQHVTPLTPNMKTGGMWFTFPQLAGGANVTFLNPRLDLSIAVEGESPSPMTERLQNKKTGWHKRKWQNGSYCYWYNNTYRREYCFRSGEEDKRIGCSQDKGGRIQSIAHSQPTRSGKEGVGYASGDVWMLMMITTSPHFTHFW